jgi:NAD+--asparagine ADP-ribosyltransferase
MNDKTFTSIKLYLSPSEKSRIESISQARGISMSEYCKNQILKTGININIKTDDLSAFAQQVSKSYDSLNELLSLSKKSASISPGQIDNVEDLLADLNNNCRMLLRERYQTRKNISTDLKTFITKYLDSK